MSSFRIVNKHYKIIPFLITIGTLLFFVFWIGGLAYKYHLETEERRILLKTDIEQKARELNEQLHQENQKLKETVKALVEEEIVYRPDGKTIFSINEYTPEGKIIKLTYYLEDGKTFNYIIEFDPQTWKRNKCTFYNSDGTIISIIEFDPQAGNEIKCTEYNSDGTIKEVRNL